MVMALASEADLHVRGSDGRETISGSDALALIALQMPITYWLTDRQLRFTMSRGPGLSAFGLDEDQLRGQTLIDYCASAAGCGDSLAQIGAHVRALSGEVVKWSGSWRGVHYESFAAPWVIDGQIVGCVGFSIVFPPDATGSRSDAPTAAPVLTPRQLEILMLLNEGADTRAIGRQLVLQETTVSNHIARVLKRLDAHTRLEAVARARNLGLLAG